jgi:hypothetical protein
MQYSYRLYKLNVVQALFDEPKKIKEPPKKMKGGNDDGSKNNDDSNKYIEDDGNDYNILDDDKDVKNKKKRGSENEDDTEDETSDGSEGRDDIRKNVNDENYDLMNEDEDILITKKTKFKALFPGLSNLIDNDTSKFYEKVSIKIHDQIYISVSCESLPVIYIKEKKCYDHIFELVGAFGEGGGFEGYRLFDETILFICSNKDVMNQLKSFTYLSFDVGIQDFDNIILNTLNHRLSQKDTKFVIKKLAPVYGGNEDTHRKIVSFVRENRSSGINYQNFQRTSNENTVLGFLKNKKFKNLLEVNDLGHFVDKACLYKLFAQVQLNKGEKVFDVGIGALMLAIHAANITQTNVDGNDNFAELLDQVKNNWGEE